LVDGLDIPIVNFFDTSFAEHHPEEIQPITRTEGDALARYGPIYCPRLRLAAAFRAPVYVSVFRSRETLDRLYRDGPTHPCHGVKVQFTNPASGSYPCRPSALSCNCCPPDSTLRLPLHRRHRLLCVEGRGSSQVGADSFAWNPHDVFVVPPGLP